VTCTVDRRELYGCNSPWEPLNLIRLDITGEVKKVIEGGWATFTPNCLTVLVVFNEVEIR